MTKKKGRPVRRTKAGRKAEQLVTLMSQEHSARYKLSEAQWSALELCVQQLMDEGVKLTQRTTSLLIPHEADSVKLAEARGKLRLTSVGAEAVITMLLQIYTEHLPQPDLQHPRLRLMLDVPLPTGVTVQRMIGYVADAVGHWSGQFNPAEDPLFGYAHNELLNPIRVRPLTVEDDLPKSLDSFVKRFRVARRMLQGMTALLERADAALAEDGK